MIQDKTTENKKIIEKLSGKLSDNFNADTFLEDDETKRNMAINKRVLINLKKSLRGEYGKN